jgi:NAD(P)-dependent dehydrogenase (short-subunit alcohol dehydrogenase family)
MYDSKLPHTIFDLTSLEMLKGASINHVFLWLVFLISLPPFLVALQPVALLTGATGRTGKLVTHQLLQDGYQVILYCRDEAKARKSFGNHLSTNQLQFLEGDLSSPESIIQGISPWKSKLTHVVFMAGGEGADYRAVNHKGVAALADCAIQCDNLSHFIVISSAWATRPYSIAALLFNSIYKDTLPMASHYLGEEALRRASLQRNMNYVILRAGGLNSDENYAKKYPDAVGKGLTYQQGDSFDFLGIAGRPGMARSQLSKAVLSAMSVEGRYTVEVTGSGIVDLDDSSVYDTLVQDDLSLVPLNSDTQEREIAGAHSQAIDQLKQTATAASLGGIVLIGVFGWIKGLALLFSLDLFIILIWSRFLANQQAC